MYIYIGIILIVLFVIHKERQALGCETILPFGRDCNNANGKVVLGTRGNPNDSVKTLEDRIKYGSKSMDRFVVWRLGVIIGFIGTILTYYILYQRFPTEIELVVGILIITFLIYFSFGFYNYHLFSFIERNTSYNIDLINKKIKV
jgi:hypothetical protein